MSSPVPKCKVANVRGNDNLTIMDTLIHKRRTTLATLSHKRRSSRQSRGSGSRIAKAVLFISFFILLGRFAYSSVTAFFHHQDKQQRIEQTLMSPSAPLSSITLSKKE